MRSYYSNLQVAVLVTFFVRWVGESRLMYVIYVVGKFRLSGNSRGFSIPLILSHKNNSEYHLVARRLQLII